MIVRKQGVFSETRCVGEGMMKNYVIIAFQLTIIAVGWFILTWMFFDAMPSLAQESVLSGTAVNSDAGQPPHHGGILSLIVQELNLTDDQKPQLRSILADERPNLKP